MLWSRIVITATLLLLLSNSAYGQTWQKAVNCYLDNGELAECSQFTDDLKQSYAVIRLFKTGADNQEKPPLFLLAGGPGQGAGKAMQPYISLLSEVRKERDFILVDQLGTGKSSPLKCPEFEKITPLEQLRDSGRVVAAMKKCGEKIGDGLVPPEAYGTDSYAKILEHVRQHLGYGNVALYGVSYGTRVAIRYGMLFPNSVASIVIEGVAGNKLRLFENSSIGRPLVVKSIEMRQKESGKVELLSDQITKLAKQLPKTVGIVDPNSGKRELITVDEMVMWHAIGLAFYDPGLVSILPYSLEEALHGNFQPLITPALTANMGVNPIHLFTVACSEDFHGEDKLPMSLLDKERKQIVTLCNGWPKYKLDKNFRNKPEFEIPTLLLAGRADPATPILFAEKLDEELKNSKLVSFDHQGHNVFYLPCATEIVVDFLTDPKSLQKIETACVKETKTPKMFATGLGPK